MPDPRRDPISEQPSRERSQQLAQHNPNQTATAPPRSTPAVMAPTAAAPQGQTTAAPQAPATAAPQGRPTTTSVRDAEPSDVPRLVELVRELAEYERALHEVSATEEHFTAALFPDDPSAARSHALVAEVETDDGPKVVGMAVWYVTFSTWLGRHGIWLEDLYVSPNRRGSGLGRALLTRLAEIAVERGYGRVEWWVLDWNTASIEFYRSLGAHPQDGWTVYRLDGAALTALGSH
jgi:GNAT superfamily N-acetyltransferase